ncbi:MAG: TlpA family protein disulfide reductase [Bacteroidales bacterium]|nr:TlpA family protein disulfide reductase [Bacteroidales bacterium]
MTRSTAVVKTLIISVIITAISLLSGSLNWVNQFILVGLGFFIGGLLFDKRNGDSIALYCSIIILPFILIYDILVFSEGLIDVYPIALIPVISFGFGIILKTRKILRKRKIFLGLFYGTLIVFTGLFAMPNWFAYVFDRNTMPVNTTFSHVSFTAESKDTIQLSELEHKIIVLDFWTTSCRVCYKKFPDLDNLYNYFADDERVGIYAVNLILKNQDLKDVRENIYSKRYSFPNLFTSQNQAAEIGKAFNFNAVPTLVIIKNNRILYKGGLNISGYILVNNAISIINEGLEESK